GGELDGTASLHADDPAELEEAGEEGGTERSRQVIDPLAPVEAGEREGAAGAGRRWQGGARRRQRAAARLGGRRLPPPAGGRPRGAERAALDQGGGQGDARSAGQVVVAGARGAHGAADRRLPVGARGAPGRQDGERLERPHRFGAGEPVVAVAAVRPRGDEP